MTAPQTNGPVGIRRAVRADLLDVVRIERDAFPQPWSYSVFERFLGEPGFLVADESVGRHAPEPTELGTIPGDANGLIGTGDDPEVVGYVVADAIPHSRQRFGHIKDIAVRSDRRGEGIGSTLLERSLVELADRGAESVRLEVRRGNDAARRLYRSFGFERSGAQTNYYADGEDALVMMRDL